MKYSIAGSAAIASIGRSRGELFANLCAGKSGLGPLRGLDARHFGGSTAYEIDDRPVGGPDVARRTTRLLVEAVEQAIDDAGLTGDVEGVPIIVGTGLAELRTLELAMCARSSLTEEDLSFGPELTRRFGFGETLTLTNACSASLHALGLAADMLSLDEADTVVVAGVDVLTASMYGLLERVHPEPPDCIRPFDRNRKGVLMGDGAAAVVLSASAAPGGRGVLRSVALNCDAAHLTAPHKAGIAAVMRAALDDAGIGPQDVDLIMAHGTGTFLNDDVEAAAIGAVYGEYVERPYLTAIKSMTGHTAGASGLMALVVAMEAMQGGTVPPTLGLVDPIDEAARFRFARNDPIEAALAVAQVNAFGFGGVNAVAIVEAVR